MEEISVQAVEQLVDQEQEYQEDFNIPFVSTAGRSGLYPGESKLSNAEISIQSSPMLPKNTGQNFYNASASKEQSFQRTVFYKEQPSLQSLQGKPSSMELKRNARSIEEDRKKIFDSSG